MILSIFLKGNTCYVATEHIEESFVCDEIREVSDVFVPLIKKVLAKSNCFEVSKFIVSAGPGSFTSVRVLNSIAKGVLVAHSNKIPCVSVSSFLTYLEVLSDKVIDAIIAISTMRNDFFCMDVGLGYKLSNFRILKEQDLISVDKKVFFDNSGVFCGCNLAAAQIRSLDSDKRLNNIELIDSFIKPVYGFAPRYKF